MISLTSPVEFWAHRLPAAGKLAALSVATGVLFAFPQLPVQVIAASLTIALYLSGGRVFAQSGARTLKVLWPFLLVVLIWHSYESAPEQGVAIALRLVTAVALANFCTMTTRLSDMIDVAAWLLSPFRAIGLKTRMLELAIALVIRFAPLLGQRGQQLSEAWRARSHRRTSWHIVMPLALQALDEADHMAEALKARGGLS